MPWPLLWPLPFDAAGGAGTATGPLMGSGTSVGRAGAGAGAAAAGTGPADCGITPAELGASATMARGRVTIATRPPAGFGANATWVS